MAYTIRITRNLEQDEDGPFIALAEWVDVVSRVEGVRLAEGDYSVRLPETGQVFTLRNNGGDTELFFPATQTWRRIFSWNEEDISFVGTEEFGVNPDCHLRTIVRTLAAELGAIVRGGDGETYA